MAHGHHKMEYEVLEGWERLPEGWSFVEVAGVAVDSRDRSPVLAVHRAVDHECDSKPLRVEAAAEQEMVRVEQIAARAAREEGGELACGHLVYVQDWKGRRRKRTDGFRVGVRGIQSGARSM